MKKSTKHVFSDRVNIVLQAILECWSRSDILQYRTKWDVNIRQMDNYIREANKRILSHDLENADKRVRKMLAQHDNIIKKAILAKQLNVAQSGLKAKAELLGDNAETKIKLGIGNVDDKPLKILLEPTESYTKDELEEMAKEEKENNKRKAKK